jgi:hypothetical protein
MHWVNTVGWLATAMSVVSYLFRDPAKLRRVQALAALLWIVYGVMLVAPPMIVANVIVAGMAFGTTWFNRSKRPATGQSHSGDTSAGVSSVGIGSANG